MEERPRGEKLKRGSFWGGGLLNWNDLALEAADMQIWNKLQICSSEIIWMQRKESSLYAWFSAMMMWWERGKPIERNAENTFMHFHFWQLAVIEDSDSFRESFSSTILWDNTVAAIFVDCNATSISGKAVFGWDRNAKAYCQESAQNCLQLHSCCVQKARKKERWYIGERVQVGKSLFEQGLLIARDTSFSIRQSLPNPWGIRELFGQKKGRERGRKWGMEKKVGSEEMGGEGWQRVHGGIFLHRLKPPPQGLPRFTAGI